MGEAGPGPGPAAAIATFQEIRDVLGAVIAEEADRKFHLRMRSIAEQHQQMLQEQVILDEDPGGLQEQQPLPWNFLSPVDVACAFSSLKPRLNFLYNLLVYQPGLASKVGLGSSNSGRFDADVSLFGLLLKELTPKAGSLRDPSSILTWVAKVNKVTTMFHTLKNCTPEEEGEKLRGFSKNLDRFNVIKLFLAHMEKHPFKPSTPTLNKLFIDLKGNSLKSKAEMDKFLTSLRQINSESVRFHFAKGSEECPVCKEDIVVEGKDPVELPCGHVGCLKCLKEFQERGTGRKEQEVARSIGTGSRIPDPYCI